MSKIIESLRGDLASLHEVGAISKVTMREFDAICLPPVREFDAADIKRLREALRFSQPVFAFTCTPQLLQCANGSKARLIRAVRPSSCSTSSQTTACRPSSDA